MKKYSVIDLQDCDFMEYTWKEPMTAHEIRKHLLQLINDNRDEFGETEMYKYEDMTLDFCSDYWEIEFIEFNTSKWAEYNDSGIVDIPF